MDPFFIVGCPRSGTTLLSVCLDRHTRLCVTPETAFFDEVAPELPARDAASLLAILARWRRLPELRLTPEAVLQELDGRVGSPTAVLTAILRLYAAANAKVRCGEKTPQHLRHGATILEQFPTARMVCPIRDGRDVALSLRAMPWGPSSLVAAAEMWRTSIECAERLAAQHPTRFLMVSFEHLAKAPEQELSSVMRFLGERFESNQLRPEMTSAVILPRSLAWKGQALGAVDPDRPGRRRTEATSHENSLLEQLLGDELRRHGYAIT